MTFDTLEILRAFDNSAGSFEFPMLDNGYYYHGDQKLTVFRDDKRWALTIETLAYNNHQLDLEGITTCVSTFGNCLLSQDDTSANNQFFFFAEEDQIPTFCDDEELYISYVNPKASSIKIRNERISIVHDREHYARKGIDLEYPDKIINYEFMRGLIPEHSHHFWLTRKELSNLIPQDVPIILSLSEWNHPDLADMQLPGQHQTFIQLATVIHSGNIGDYRPTLQPNTHWSNWPNGGAF